MLSFLIYPVMVFALQGGFGMNVQFTDYLETFQAPAHIDTFQGNQEDGDSLQPALGFNALNQPFSGTLEVRG